MVHLISYRQSHNRMNNTQSIASSSTLPGPKGYIPRHPLHPFVSAQNRAEGYDGIYRVVLISTGSVASVKIPDIVGGLCTVSLLPALSSCYMLSSAHKSRICRLLYSAKGLVMIQLCFRPSISLMVSFSYAWKDRQHCEVKHTDTK